MANARKPFALVNTKDIIHQVDFDWHSEDREKSSTDRKRGHVIKMEHHADWHIDGEYLVFVAFKVRDQPTFTEITAWFNDLYRAFYPTRFVELDENPAIERYATRIVGEFYRTQVKDRILRRERDKGWTPANGRRSKKKQEFPARSDGSKPEVPAYNHVPSYRTDVSEAALEEGAVKTIYTRQVMGISNTASTSSKLSTGKGVSTGNAANEKAKDDSLFSSQPVTISPLRKAPHKADKRNTTPGSQVVEVDKGRKVGSGPMRSVGDQAASVAAKQKPTVAAAGRKIPQTVQGGSQARPLGFSGSGSARTSSGAKVASNLFQQAIAGSRIEFSPPPVIRNMPPMKKFTKEGQLRRLEEDDITDLHDIRHGIRKYPISYMER
jgi:hypothetical protein